MMLSSLRLLLILFLLIAVGGAVRPAVAAAPLQHVQVVESEFHFNLSRVILSPGAISFQLVNFGADDHNLIMQRKGSTKLIVFPSLHSGEKRDIIITLSAGRYRMWCGIGDHAKHGMTGEIIIK